MPNVRVNGFLHFLHLLHFESPLSTFPTSPLSLFLLPYSHCSSLEMDKLFQQAPEPKTPLGRYRVFGEHCGLRVSPLQLGASLSDHSPTGSSR